MKKNVLLVLIAFSTLDLFSQVDKGNIMISIDGNYMKMSTESGVHTNYNETHGKYLSIGTSIGYFFTNRFVAGIGIDYNWGKEIRINELYLNNSLQEEEMNITTKALLPNLYFEYYLPIMNKLYFSVNLKLSFGKIKSEFSYCYARVVRFQTDSLYSGTNPLYIPNLSTNSKFGFFSTKVSPELTYFISSKFGLCLGLGGIEYSMIDWKNVNSSWTINFNPNYWRLGIKFKI